ncbi:MAG: MerR family transcriptional regulator [Acidimicrobiales bacterium]
MRISELSRTSSVSVPTIKYYLREGLLEPGSSTGPNRADYGESHVHRLRLIRVLMDVGGLSVAAIGDVLDAIADESLSMHEVAGRAQYALGPAATEGEDVPDDLRHARGEVDRFLAGLGWHNTPGAPGRRALADALVALWRLGRGYGVEVFRPYAELSDKLAAHEVTIIEPDATRSEAVEAVVVGVVVFEAALVALRRLAQEHHSWLRSGTGAEKLP